MNISPELKEAVGMDPTKQSSSHTILDICKYIDAGTLTIPAYQRDISWTLKQSIDLLNYQLRGKSPVSALSVNKITKNESAKEVDQLSIISRKKVEAKVGQHLSIVDGQQRITTNYKAYIDHDDFKPIVLDLEKGCFLSSKKVSKKNQIQVGVLLNKDNSIFESAIAKFPASAQMVLMRARTKLTSYSYTINQANDLTEKEQIEWFEVLNNAGSRVKDLQLKIAQIKTSGVDVYTDFTRRFVQKIKEAFNGDNFFAPQSTHVSAPIATLNPAYEKLVRDGRHSNNFSPMAPDAKSKVLNSLLKENEHRFQECITRTLDALDMALDFIKTSQLTVGKNADIDRIDYINYLTGYFVFNDKHPSTDEINNIIDWVKNTKFTNKSNSERRQIFTDLIEQKWNFR